MFQLAAMQRGRPAGTLGKKNLHVCPLIVDDNAHFLQAARRLRAATRGAHCRPLDPRLAIFSVPQEDPEAKM